jgi:hypothetical protein
LRVKLQKFPPSATADDAAVAAAVRSSLLTDADESSTSRIAQLEKLIQETTRTLTGVQKQIQRGEEVYYEESYGFGSLFSGFESVLDSRGVGDGGSSNNMIRRMPADARWFSLPLHAYPPPPPPVITNHIPVTVESLAAAGQSAAAASATLAKAIALSLDKKDQSSLVGTRRKQDVSAELNQSSDRDDDDTNIDGDDGDDAQDLGVAEVATAPSVAEARETRSKRKSTTPLVSRRPKRKKR